MIPTWFLIPHWYPTSKRATSRQGRPIWNSKLKWFLNVSKPWTSIGQMTQNLETLYRIETSNAEGKSFISKLLFVMNKQTKSILISDCNGQKEKGKTNAWLFSRLHLLFVPQPSLFCSAPHLFSFLSFPCLLSALTSLWWGGNPSPFALLFSLCFVLITLR